MRFPYAFLGRPWPRYCFAKFASIHSFVQFKICRPAVTIVVTALANADRRAGPPSESGVFQRPLARVSGPDLPPEPKVARSNRAGRMLHANRRTPGKFANTRCNLASKLQTQPDRLHCRADGSLRERISIRDLLQRSRPGAHSRVQGWW